MNTVEKFALCTLLLASSTNALAEFGGGTSGRTLDMNMNQGSSAETFYRGYSGATEMGVRLSHRYNNDLLVYADFTRIERDLQEGSSDSLDGDGYGAGFFYFLPGRLEGYDVAARASYHTYGTSGSGAEIQIDGLAISNASSNLDRTGLTAELMLSPLEPLQDNGLTWYAGIGISKNEEDLSIRTPTANFTLVGVTGKQSSTEVIGSLGLVLPMSFGQAFAAMDFEDGAAFSLGARYQF